MWPSYSSIPKASVMFIMSFLLCHVTSTYSKFKVAVYEHTVDLPNLKIKIDRESALITMMKNLDVYKEQTIAAKASGADMIVFPEGGLYGVSMSRRQQAYFLETIPNPKNVTWSPCADPTRFPNTEVLHTLSCLAHNNSIYLVANMGDTQPAGRFQYNTAVAFSPEGVILAKYHKVNLFYEPQWDRGNTETVYFDTPFGRFGMFICYDILYNEPAVTMVTRENITNIVFPTAWFDSLPLFSAVGFHSSYARGLGVNLIVANLHSPGTHTGSGVYSPLGTEAFYYNNTPASPGKLIISEVDVIQPILFNGGVSGGRAPVSSELKSRIESNTLNKEDGDSVYVNGQEVFHAKVVGDRFTFKLIEKDAGFVSVNQKNVSCYLNYSKTTDNSDVFAVGAYDGLHTLNKQFYFQTCLLLRCADPRERASCGSVTSESHTVFQQLDLWGDFDLPHVYPQLLISDGDSLALTEKGSWEFTSEPASLHVRENLAHPVLSATLLGRASSGSMIHSTGLTCIITCVWLILLSNYNY